MSVVRAEHVSVRTGDRARLTDASLQVAAGEVHALVGPNGSGKSTLLAVLAGDLAPDEGSVRFDGLGNTDDAGAGISDDRARGAAPESPRRRSSRTSAAQAARRRALLAQETPLAFPFTVRDVVSWGRLPWRGTPQQAEDDEVIAAVIAEHGLTELLDRPVPELSGGERARVHLARVLAQRAPLLLLDEADAALDLAGQAHLDEAVRRRRDAGCAVVLVGHDLGRLSALADSASLLSRGRIIAQGPAAQTLTAESLSEAYGIRVSYGEADGRRVFWAQP